MDNELYERIKICVGHDLIGHKNIVMYDNMSATQQIRFNKQINRLYDACMLEPKGENYINERYNAIMRKKQKKMGCPPPTQVFTDISIK